MEGIGVVYEQEEPAPDAQPQPAAADTLAVGDAPQDDDDVRALAANPDSLDQQQQQQPNQHQAQYQAQQQQMQQHQSYADYAQSSGQHPQQQMEHHSSYGDKTGTTVQPGKLFIGGVSWETTEDTLRQHFGKYGALADAALMKDKYTGQPRGFGFVTFEDATGKREAGFWIEFCYVQGAGELTLLAGSTAAIDRVLDETHTLDGRTVEVKRAIPRERSGQGSRLVLDTRAASRAAVCLLLVEGEPKKERQKGRKEGREESNKKEDEKQKTIPTQHDRMAFARRLLAHHARPSRSPSSPSPSSAG
jgi:hypothetical protein